MIYLSQSEFPSKEKEFDFFLAQKRTCYDSFYPFQILSKHDLRILDFEPITILYGGNGSGKTTALNVIAEKLLRIDIGRGAGMVIIFSGVCLSVVAVMMARIKSIKDLETMKGTV